jgi:hypothetical protein
VGTGKTEPKLEQTLSRSTGVDSGSLSISSQSVRLSLMDYFSTRGQCQICTPSFLRRHEALVGALSMYQSEWNTFGRGIALASVPLSVMPPLELHIAAC